MRNSILLLLILSSSLAFSQKKARNDDLRTIKNSFHIKISGMDLKLNSENGSYFFQGSSGDKIRVTTEEAKKLEAEFSSVYLYMKYEVATEDSACKTKDLLVLFGESFEYCNTNKKRSKALGDYLVKLDKYLK